MLAFYSYRAGLCDVTTTTERNTKLIVCTLSFSLSYSLTRDFVEHTYRGAPFIGGLETHCLRVFLLRATVKIETKITSAASISPEKNSGMTGCPISTDTL